MRRCSQGKRGMKSAALYGESWVWAAPERVSDKQVKGRRVSGGERFS